jgi:hypothetical protein
VGKRLVLISIANLLPHPLTPRRHNPTQLQTQVKLKRNASGSDAENLMWPPYWRGFPDTSVSSKKEGVEPLNSTPWAKTI